MPIQDAKPCDIVAFAAHPDDVELNCGGTLAVAAAHGWKAGVVDFTRGELGTLVPISTNTAPPICSDFSTSGPTWNK